MRHMWRVAVVGLLLLVGASRAHAAPAPWTFDAPPGWSDISKNAEVVTALQTARQPIVDGGGTFDATVYRNDAGTVLFIVTSDVASLTTLDARDGMEAGAAKRGRQNATERTYTDERTASVFNTTQRVTIQGTPVVTRRVEGFLHSGALRAISINCYGEDAICDPVISAVHIDDTNYRPLSSVPRSGPSRAYRLGTIVGSAFGALLFVLIINALRRRFA